MCTAVFFCQLERAEAARKRSCQDFAAVVFVIKREDLAGLMDLAAVAAEAVEATASSQQIIEVAPTGRAASTRSAQRQQAPPAQQDQQKQKLRALISAAQQRVLQQLPAAMACQAQRLWEGATAVAVRPAEANAAALVAKRNVAALAETAPLAVSPEWIASCWAEARRVPADTAHGRVQASMNSRHIPRILIPAELCEFACSPERKNHGKGTLILLGMRAGTRVLG